MLVCAVVVIRERVLVTMNCLWFIGVGSEVCVYGLCVRSCPRMSVPILISGPWARLRLQCDDKPCASCDRSIAVCF